MSLLSKHIDKQKETQSTSDEITKVQLNICIFVIMIGYIRTFELASVYISENINLYLFLTLTALLISVGLSLTIYFKPKYLKLVIHLSLIIALLDLFNKVLLMQKFYIVHFQVIFMMIVWSIYGLGRWFSITYSLLFSSLIFTYIYIYGTNFSIFPEKTDPSYYACWIAYYINNILFIWSHYYYYKHLKKIIKNKRYINKELSKSLKKITKFSSKVTKQLNLPLNSIIKTSTDLLNRNFDQAKRKNLELLKFSSESLLEIINNIQSYSRIDKSKKEIKAFDLAKLLKNIVELFEVKTKEQNIKFSFEYSDILDKTLIISDKNLIMQILYNLLGNAIKFTPPNGQITLSVLQLPYISNNQIKLKFSVKDTGIGIESNKIQEIFKPFKQADNSITRKYGGTGLGLSIVQKALKSLKSNINIETEYSKGSTFSFEVLFETIIKK